MPTSKFQFAKTLDRSHFAGMHHAAFPADSSQFNIEYTQDENFVINGFVARDKSAFSKAKPAIEAKMVLAQNADGKNYYCYEVTINRDDVRVWLQYGNNKGGKGFRLLEKGQATYRLPANSILFFSNNNTIQDDDHYLLKNEFKKLWQEKFSAYSASDKLKIKVSELVQIFREIYQKTFPNKSHTEDADNFNCQAIRLLDPRVEYARVLIENGVANKSSPLVVISRFLSFTASSFQQSLSNPDITEITGELVNIIDLLNAETNNEKKPVYKIADNEGNSIVLTDFLPIKPLLEKDYWYKNGKKFTFLGLLLGAASLLLSVVIIVSNFLLLFSGIGLPGLVLGAGLATIGLGLLTGAFVSFKKYNAVAEVLQATAKQPPIEKGISHKQIIGLKSVLSVNAQQTEHTENKASFMPILKKTPLTDQLKQKIDAALEQGVREAVIKELDDLLAENNTDEQKNYQYWLRIDNKNIEFSQLTAGQINQFVEEQIKSILASNTFTHWKNYIHENIKIKKYSNTKGCETEDLLLNTLKQFAQGRLVWLKKNGAIEIDDNKTSGAVYHQIGLVDSPNKTQQHIHIVRAIA